MFIVVLDDKTNESFNLTRSEQQTMSWFCLYDFHSQTLLAHNEQKLRTKLIYGGCLASHLIVIYV